MLLLGRESSCYLSNMSIKTKNSHSAGGVVLNSDKMILVVNQNGDSWSLPKGHIELGEDEMAAARREIYEESGIDNLDFVGQVGEYRRYKIGKNGGDDKTELKKITMFLFNTNQNILKSVDPENPEARWVKKNEVVQLLTHKKDKEFFTSIIDRF
ncbi:hypothetical protein COV58_00785 [Candidatus Roizmanbacteria bacterium CG11_big_fil_rev_8_21_14_0_20_36_8]|uniref:Nudix hydrolase domain-containing protein n=2 Tax=Candidatus Roizmaniibacteriota TaxID=1752723 RepID=A0A2M6IV05_9BACT|nr:MAG: hypothetical protein COV58_00785 [Candidatus Roizmanbacteria bacterium CG11_big_fil_rev_8_21_14_0_20_36_8]